MKRHHEDLRVCRAGEQGFRRSLKYLKYRIVHVWMVVRIKIIRAGGLGSTVGRRPAVWWW